MLTRIDCDSPIGGLTLIFRNSRLVILDYADCSERTAAIVRRGYGEACPVRGCEASSAVARLDDYFAGDLGALDAIPVLPLDRLPIGTPFQRRVWNSLREIPAGQTTTYGEIARRIGCPGAVRAVGSANGANPLSIIWPCHRVVRRDGALGGYAGGLDRKRWLLRHERQAAGVPCEAAAVHASL